MGNSVFSYMCPQGSTVKMPRGDLHKSPERHSCLNYTVYDASSTTHLSPIVLNMKEFKEERREDTGVEGVRNASRIRCSCPKTACNLSQPKENYRGV